MKRRYQLTVFVEYIDELKDSAAAGAGDALRTASEDCETAIRVALTDGPRRAVTRKGIRVHVTAASVVEVE